MDAVDAYAGSPPDPQATLDSVMTPAYGFWEAFVNSVVMILATELGDRTFFLAAILAMQFDRLVVFGGAIGALAVMTVLSAAIGFTLPNLLPKQYTHYAAIMLFGYFGLRMLKDASGMQGGAPSEELQEVEDELGKVKQEDGEPDDVEAGAAAATAERGKKIKNKVLAVLTEAFTLTFLAEWGDKSQIATIALAAAKDPFGVTLGGIVGHSLCTGLAVIGGRMLATKMSEKTVTTVGGVLFLVFAVHAIVAGP